jgi:hypothetical protein
MKGGFMKKLSFIILLFSAVVIGAPLAALAQNPRLFAEAERITGDDFSFAARTARGAVIYSVRQPSRSMLAAIDRGLNDLFAIARRNGYRRGLSHSSYTIFIANADRGKDASGRYSPDIAVGAAQYAGTDYDQGGYIFAAGMIIARNPMAFVIAEHTANFERVSELVRYEGEHLVLYQNDRRRYEQTKDHSQGGGHPILR